MDASLKVFGIDRLGIDERLALIESIWNSITSESERIPVTSAQRTELDRRMADHVAHPDDVHSWDDIKDAIAKRLGQ